MSVVPSLLQAIVKVDGDAMVIHVGEKPYVVAPSGQVELASRGLTLEAVDGIVGQLLPAELQIALEEFGAVQYELPASSAFPKEHFTVVAARGGDDVWVEVRRRRVPDDDDVPEDFFQPRPQKESDPKPVPAFLRQTPEHAEPRVTLDLVDDDLSLPNVNQLFSGARARGTEEGPDAPIAVDAPEPTPARKVPEVQLVTPPPVPPVVVAPSPAVVAPRPAVVAPRPVVVAPSPAVVTPRPAVVAPPPVARQPIAAPPVAEVKTPPPPPRPIAVPPLQQAVVLPIARNPVRSTEQPPPVVDPTMSGLDRLLRLSAARGASTLYLSSDSRPSVRVDGELQIIDSEQILTSRDVESLLLTLMPDRSHEALRTGAATEWICDIEGVGRVRCMSFRDQRGPGGIFRLMPTRSVSAEQLGLPPAVVALAVEPEGLVIVAGPRSSGKRTLISAFVDQINRTRRDHVITIERELNIVHASGSSFVSQREVRGNDDDVLAAARGALREDPDVLVIEDLRTGPLMNVALEAAASGRLVIGGFSAHTATGAIDRIIDLYAPEHRRQVQLALADSLRGVIVQVLLAKTGGGRVPAREVLLNTPAVSGVIAEGKTSQLPMAIEGGRRHGMMPINDALVGLVQSGSVDAREAYRRSTDRAGFLAALKRGGIDTSFVERPA